MPMLWGPLLCSVPGGGTWGPVYLGPQGLVWGTEWRQTSPCYPSMCSK